jgi:hypothetical protein
LNVSQLPGAVFLLAIGAGVLAVAYLGHRKGELPAGTSFLRACRPSRIDNRWRSIASLSCTSVPAWRSRCGGC